MKLLKIQREKDYIRYKVEQKGHMANEEKEITSHEAPLDSFDEAMEHLADAAMEMMELPPSWLGYMDVKWMELTYSKSGTRQAQIGFSKYYIRVEASKTEKTPKFYIEDGQGEEEHKREAPDKVVELVINMIYEAEKYINGERKQQLLPLPEGGEPVEPADGDQMDMEMPVDWEGVNIPFVDGTDIPDWKAMERPHALWWIDRYKEKTNLKVDIEYWTQGKIDARKDLESCKSQARELLEKEVW